MASPNRGGDGARIPPVLPSIPLAPDIEPAHDGSIGDLVKDATTHLSTLVRSEVELARQEVTAEAKKALQGGIFFIVALAILLFSLFYFFFFLVELLNEWLLPWASNLIVFGLMLLSAGALAGLGVWRMTKLRAPRRTISTVRDTAAALTQRH